MALFLQSIASIIFIASSLIFLRLQYTTKTQLSLKRILLGGVLGCLLGVSFGTMIDGKIHIDISLIGGCLMSIMGIVLVLGQWNSNKLVSRFNKKLDK